MRAGAALLAASTLIACSDGVGGSGDVTQVTNFTFSPVDPLLQADVDRIVQTAAESIDATNLAIVVMDRVGNILRVWNRTPSVGFIPTGEAFPVETKYAAAMANAATFLSHSQAPLTSRTGQFLSTFHFPNTFDTASYLAAPPNAFPPPAGSGTPPIQPTTGVFNTPQAPLWQIDASNRGGMDNMGYNAGQGIPSDAQPFLANADGTRPRAGLGPLPGGVPLYKTSSTAAGESVPKRLVGSIGCYSWEGADPTTNARPDIAEFAAFSGSLAINPTSGEDYTFAVQIPFAGAVLLVGVLLPYIDPPVLPAGFNAAPGTYNPAVQEVCGPTNFAGCDANVVLLNGLVDPIGDLVGPRDSTLPSTASDGLTDEEVNTLLQATVRASEVTHAAIRLPADSACQMVITICDMDGVILGAYREPDATIFSLEISVSKARNAVFFSDPNSINADPASPTLSDGTPTVGRHPLFAVFGEPMLGDPAALARIDGIPPDTGIAVTARSLGFLSQPFYPPNIDTSSLVGPFNSLALENRDPLKYDGQGFESAAPAAPGTVSPANNRSGIIFFPGSAPLYRNGVLIGGIGVSGDGVEQDDLVTSLGIQFAEQGFTSVNGNTTLGTLSTTFPPIGFDLEPDPAIRIDNFEYAGIKVPYFKFPQNPGG